MKQPILRIEAPSRGPSVRVLRAVAKAAAASADRSFSQLEDIDLALDEACGSLFELDPTGPLQCSIVDDGDAFRISVAAPVSAGSDPWDQWEESLNAVVLHSIASDVELGYDEPDAMLTFSIG